jgi:hypothetical protein|tara:strand:+ start:5462 stop:5776 length:315 start_codon:yes stop_codon:yes gene_type:complete
MKEFPKKLNVNNIDKFSTYRLERVLAYMRKEITENMLFRNEENYFDLEKFKNMFVLTKENLEEIILIIVKELEILGWKTQLGFGGTALFIFIDSLPANCYEDEF